MPQESDERIEQHRCGGQCASPSVVTCDAHHQATTRSQHPRNGLQGRQRGQVVEYCDHADQVILTGDSLEGSLSMRTFEWLRNLSSAIAPTAGSGSAPVTSSSAPASFATRFPVPHPTSSARVPPALRTAACLVHKPRCVRVVVRPGMLLVDGVQATDDPAGERHLSSKPPAPKLLTEEGQVEKHPLSRAGSLNRSDRPARTPCEGQR